MHRKMWGKVMYMKIEIFMLEANPISTSQCIYYDYSMNCCFLIPYFQPKTKNTYSVTIYCTLHITTHGNIAVQ